MAMTDGDLHWIDDDAPESQGLEEAGRPWSEARLDFLTLIEKVFSSDDR